GHVEGFADTFAAHFRAVYADVAAGGPSPRPTYPTFADGHEEMLGHHATRRWSRRDARQRRHRRERQDRALGRRRPRPRRTEHDRTGGAHLMRLGLLTAPFPETPLMDVVDWTAPNGFESIEIACWPRAPAAT